MSKNGRPGVPKNSPGRLWSWLSGQMERVPSWHECILTLQYDGGGADRMTLATYPARTLPKDETVAQELIELAQGDCDARGSKTQYVVQVVSEKEGVSITHGTHLLRLRPTDVSTLEASDAPDARGLLAQTMRHLEVVMQLNARMLIQQQTAMSSILESQSKILDAISSRASRLQEELEEVRRLDPESTERQDRLLDLAERLLPSLLTE